MPNPIIIRDERAHQPMALAIGNFDGIHLGHRLLIDSLSTAANARALPAALMTFEPHPLSVIRQKPVRRISGISDKVRLLQHNGKISTMFMLRFNSALANTTAEDFASLLFDTMQVRYVVVGENFRFGKQRKGDIELLNAAAKKRGAECAPASMHTDNNGIISSGRIRRHIQEGELDSAAALLARPWWLAGRVKHGRGFGRTLGFATANIHLNYIPAGAGIYAAAVMHNHKTYAAALSIGTNPAVSSGEQMHIEAHILNFSDNLYGSRLTIRPVRKLRDEINYDSIDKLRTAIANDVEQVRNLYQSQQDLFSAFSLY